MKKILALLALCSLLSCNKADTITLSETNKEFPANRWQKEDTKKFKFTIGEGLMNADVKLLFSHVHEPGYTSVPLVVTISGPDGLNDEVPVNLQLTGADGKPASQCAGDVCDLTVTIQEGATLKAGDYQIAVTSTFNNAYVPNVLAVGVKIEHPVQ
ncbi:hypothetical protein FMM05_08845 [Flavobacterium zepuense]|uniref:Lipoprotein n=1 Tax=Flavobacterium zepuense TaxID=2593302 RepID=A0A552V2B4_9FLAO|nr:hypothetical protein [Flavobacterium zepuense]TRW24610.1 hypothetical protein FMM05_08845 [Flavobacterium zepuense]